MTRRELLNSSGVKILEEDKRMLLDLFSVYGRILEKYPASNNHGCSYTTKMRRAKDGIKNVKDWCEELITE